MARLTVYTPTFNRAYILGQCYRSLKNQTCRDFLWLIIDDGSDDETKSLVDGWIEEGKVEIEYIYKENGGMHTAHNVAYENIHTELNVCIDSDDYMPNDAVEKIIRYWDKYGDDSFGGIYALDAFPDGKIIGNRFPDELKYFNGYGCREIYHNNKRVHKVEGDKKFISVTKVLKQYPPIPVFEGEKYYSLYYKQHFIERDYKILLMNEVVCIVDYLPDGSSMNIYKQYINNPRGFADIRKVVMTMAPSFKLRFTQCIHYVASSIRLRNKKFIQESPKKVETVLAVPFGVLLYWYISFNYNKLVNVKK